MSEGKPIGLWREKDEHGKVSFTGRFNQFYLVTVVPNVLKKDDGKEPDYHLGFKLSPVPDAPAQARATGGCSGQCGQCNQDGKKD